MLACTSRVCSAERCQQLPQRAALSQIKCLSHWDVLDGMYILTQILQMLTFLTSSSKKCIPLERGCKLANRTYVRGMPGDTRAAGRRGLDYSLSAASTARLCHLCPTTRRQRIAHTQINNENLLHISNRYRRRSDGIARNIRISAGLIVEINSIL